jgi:hypothetical protein
MTLDEAIEQLTKLRAESKLGGETNVYCCLIASEIEYLEIESFKYEPDPDGALILALVTGMEIGE